MPTLLDDRLVTDALNGLTGWSGDAKAIRRTVGLADSRAEALLAEVAQTAAAMDHHPSVERSGEALVFTLSTSSVGGVTEYDIALASRIDDLILKVTDGPGSVAGAPGAGGGLTGSGRRESGAVRDDAQVPSTAQETAERGDSLAPPDGDQLGPGVGAAGARQDTPNVPLPDAADPAQHPGAAGGPAGGSGPEVGTGGTDQPGPDRT